MKFLFKRSIRNVGNETNEVEADSRKDLQMKIMAERPDMEWQSSEMFDYLVGKKWREDGSGTDEIIVIRPTLDL